MSSRRTRSGVGAGTDAKILGPSHPPLQISVRTNPQTIPRSIGRWIARTASLTIALASVSAVAPADAFGASAAQTTSAGEDLRARANAARVAVLAQDPRADRLLDAIEAALAERVAEEPGQLELRLHVLRSRLLWFGAEDSARVGALDAQLASLAAEARSLPGPRGFALLYRAEIALARGDRTGSRALCDRVLLLPESDATWEAQVLAEDLRARTLDAPEERGEALRGLRRARGLLGRVRARSDADHHLERARPIHERLAGRLLEEAAARPADAQPLLREALDALEDLKRAELRAYFGDPCLGELDRTTPERLAGARLLYPVVLEERVVLIVGRDGELAQVDAAITPAELRTESRNLRGALQDPTSPRWRAAATRLYEALIRPLEKAPIALGAAADGTAETLVFVPMGALREIPIAALYDAREGRFLIEQTAIATLPSLRIEPPRPLDRRRTALLAVALTTAADDFPALPFAARELEAVARPFRTTRRLDAEFSKQGFADTLDQRPFDIVHIASHGRFDAQANESFLLAQDGRITLPELGYLIARTRHRTRRPLELLVLSACETAIGDERAVLGLAGVAVQSGARSAVASLWKVHDEATMELFSRFYRELARPGVSRAEALRRAQRTLITEKRFQHPIYWSAFLLVNGWL